MPELDDIAPRHVRWASCSEDTVTNNENIPLMPNSTIHPVKSQTHDGEQGPEGDVIIPKGKKTRRGRRGKGKKTDDEKENISPDSTQEPKTSPKNDGETNSNATKSKNKGKRRSRKGKGKKEDDDKENIHPNSTQNPDKSLTPNDRKSKKKPKKKSKRSGRRGLDRYFGIFHCKGCNRTWQSAHVFTPAGSPKVLWRQACKECKDAWIFPFQKELIRCSLCLKTPCVCVCDDCGRLKHRPPTPMRKVTYQDDEDPPQKPAPVEYCRCDRKKKKRDLGGGDLKKPHLSELCEKCQSGFPCGLAGNDEKEANFYSGEDNEP